MSQLGFVGRGRECQELTRLAAAAQEGRGALVLIRGEAGVGKTSLVTWLLSQVAPATVAVSRCVGPDETPLYGPWRALAAQLDELSWPVPLLPRGERPAAVATAAAYGYALSAMLAQAIRSDGRPLVLAIEDVQWADPASLDLLVHVAQHITRLALLLIVTVRSPESEALSRTLAELHRAGATRFALERFTPDEVTQLTAAALPDRPGQSLIAHYLHQRTGGHPLFLCELLAAVQTGSNPEGPLPDTVQQAISQQLNQLTPHAMTILQGAAVIGERFSYDLLQQVTDAGEEELLATLEAALGLRVLRQERMSGEQFAFDHALVRELLLGQLIGPRRRRWHLRVAEALIASNADPETVAGHLERAGDDRAVSYLLLAGDKALQLGARSQAAGRYEQALASLSAHGSLRAEVLLKLAHAADDDAAQRYCAEALRTALATGDAAVGVWARHQLVAWHSEHPSALSELQEVRAAQQALLADDRYRRLEAALYGEALAYPRANGALALALTKAGRRPEAEAIVAQMQARTRPGERRTPILWVQWWMAGLMGRWQDAFELGRPLCGALQTEGNTRSAFTVASNRLYHVLLCKADEPEAVDLAVAALLRLAEQLAEVSGYDPLAAGHPPLGWYSYLRGDWEMAHRHLLGYLENHPADADPGVRGFAVMLQLAQGDTAGARATLLAVPPLHPDEEPGLHTVQLSAYTMRADLCLAEGDADGARAWLDAAVRYQQLRGGTAFQASLKLAWARVHLAAGDLETAHAQAEEAVARAQAPVEFRALIAASRLAGEVAARLGRMPEAAAHLERAAKLAERCNFPYELAMTQLVHAEVVQSPSAKLTAARDTFARLGAAPALARADAISNRKTTTDLSARELEIVRLVAQGLTDKAVAAHLFISPRTVDGHMRRIFAKLDVPSRTAMAAHALRHGWI